MEVRDESDQEGMSIVIELNMKNTEGIFDLFVQEDRSSNFLQLLNMVVIRLINGQWQLASA